DECDTDKFVFHDYSPKLSCKGCSMLTNVFQSASRIQGLFIEDPDTCEGVSRAHFHHEATACRNSGSTARKNLPSSRTRRYSCSFPLTGSRCWNSISV